MSAPFSSIDLVRGAFYTGWWYWQWSTTSQSGRKWYEMYRQRLLVGRLLPGRVFGIAWAIIFTLLGISTYLYDRNYAAVGDFHIAVMWLILGNGLANKLWSWLFFDRSQKLASLALIALVIEPSAILIAIFMALDSAWVSFGLWLLYPAWLILATLLNLGWLQYGFPTNDASLTAPMEATAPLQPISHMTRAHSVPAPPLRGGISLLAFDDDDGRL